MSWLLGFAGAMCLLDVFQHNTSKFTQRQEWELVIGLVLVMLGVVVYVWRDHEED